MQLVVEIVNTVQFVCLGIYYLAKCTQCLIYNYNYC
jgi:hypothetical protein